MWVRTQRFLKALLTVKPALGRHGNERLFHFEGKRVTANNGELRISAPLPRRMDIGGGVPAKELIDLLEKKNAEYVEVNTDSERLYLSVDDMTVRLVKDNKLLPKAGAIMLGEESWHPIPGDFQEKLRLIYSSISENKNHPALTCVHWRGTIMEACNNTCFSCCVLDSPLPDDYGLLIARETAAVLKNEDYELTHFSVEGGWLYFKCGGDIAISCRLYSDEYLPIEKILSLHYGKPFRLPVDMPDILKGSSKIAPIDAVSEPFIQVHVADGILTVDSKREADCPEHRIINSDETIRFWINPDILRDIIVKGFDRVAISKRQKGVFELFLRFDSKDFTHVIGTASVLDKSDIPPLFTSEESGETQGLDPIAMYCAGTEGFELIHKRLRSEMKNRLLTFAYAKGNTYDKYLTEPHRSNYQNIMFDSGAFSVWKRGHTISNSRWGE